MMKIMLMLLLLQKLVELMLENQLVTVRKVHRFTCVVVVILSMVMLVIRMRVADDGRRSGDRHQLTAAVRESPICGSGQREVRSVAGCH